MLRAFSTATAVVVLLALSSASCGGGAESSDAGGEARAQAQKIWESRCVTCHGNAGKGDGPGSAALHPKPRSFGDKKWQVETTDDRIQRVIVEGGAAVGLSPNMAPNPDLKDKPEVVAALLEIVREFK